MALPAGGELIELPSGTLGIGDFQIDNLALYPNPATNVLYMEGLPQADLEVRIVDMQGRIVMSQSIQTNNGLDVSSLTSGMYQLMIVDGNTIVGNKKFVKN